MRTLTAVSIFVLVLTVACNDAQDKTEMSIMQPRYLELNMRSRDPNSDKVIITREKIDPANIGIVIIDMWDYQGCVTIVGRAEALIERMNKSLEVARKLGMQVLWSPTDVASMYVGTPQYERALATPIHAVPKVRTFFDVDYTFKGDKHMCGPWLDCPYNWGQGFQHEKLVMTEEDLMLSGDKAQLYSICKERDITHLIYMGVHISQCVTYRSVGIEKMYETGLNCILARDATDSGSYYDPETGFTPDDGTALTIAELETAIPSINMLEEMKKTAVWGDDRIVDHVWMVPWGLQNQPYLYEEDLTVTLTTPHLKNVEIRYTLDGSEPTAAAVVYVKPLKLSETTTVRAKAFRDGEKVSLISSGYFVRLGPIPPMPDVYMDQIEPLPRAATWPGEPAYLDFYWIPKMNQSYEGKPLHTIGKLYDKGMGMRAPGNFLCEIKPEYDRFVAITGVDENLLDRSKGALTAYAPSVRFLVFIDGELACESPILRIGQPWRFDVKIHEGARIIDLVTTDAGSRSMLDLGNWVNAGFILKK